jgi:hypothetical protein
MIRFWFLRVSTAAAIQRIGNGGSETWWPGTDSARSCENDLSASAAADEGPGAPAVVRRSEYQES